MTNLSNASRVIAEDLRRAEKSIVAATRDLAHFLANALDASLVNGVSPQSSQPVVETATAALAQLAVAQRQVAFDCHRRLSKVGTLHGLTVTDYGAGDPKPAPSIRTSGALEPAETVAA